MATFNDFTELPGTSPTDIIRHVRTENMPEGRRSIETMNPDTPYVLEIIPHNGGYAVTGTNISTESTERSFFIEEGQFQTFSEAQRFAKGQKIGKEVWFLTPGVTR